MRRHHKIGAWLHAVAAATFAGAALFYVVEGDWTGAPISGAASLCYIACSCGYLHLMRTHA